MISISKGKTALPLKISYDMMCLTPPPPPKMIASYMYSPIGENSQTQNLLRFCTFISVIIEVIEFHLK